MVFAIDVNQLIVSRDCRVLWAVFSSLSLGTIRSLFTSRLATLSNVNCVKQGSQEQARLDRSGKTGYIS